MANRYAVATGIWSNPAIWDGGILPQVGDDVRPNGFTVTIDIDIDVNALRRNVMSPSVAGGTFLCSDTRLIAADIYADAVAGSCITISGLNNTMIVGDVYGASAINTPTIQNNSTGIIYLVGNVNGSFINPSYTLGGGSFDITGDITGGASTGTNTSTVSNCSNVIVRGNIYTGTVVSGNNSYNGIQNTANVTVYGNLIGNSVSTGARCVSNATTLTLIGNATSIGSFCASCTNLIMTGTAKGGVQTAITAVNASGNIHCQGSDTATHNGAGLLVTGVSPVTILSARANANNRPFAGAVRMASGSTYTVIGSTGSPVIFSEEPDPANPADVRLGTTYANGALTGTCAVPPAGAVSLGVPVDNTVGSLATSAVVAADLLNEMETSNLPIAVRMRNTATDAFITAAITAITPAP